MKRQILYASVSFAIIAGLGSCSDGFLDCYPTDRISDANFWQTEDHLKAAANVFTDSFMGKDWLNRTEIMADSAPWAATTAWRTIGSGNYSTDIPQINSVWVDCYTNIGRTNYFLANYNRATAVKQEIKNRYAAEAYFYRAYNYWILTSYFGDVPYVTDVLNVKSPDVYRGRDPRATIIEKITKDLKDHYKALPEYIEAASGEFGRVSQEAALLLLSRIYLYNERWSDAADACKKAMQSPYHRLYSTNHPNEDYLNLFRYKGRASRNAANHETILAIVFNDGLGDKARYSHNLSREISEPTDYVRWIPTKSMVECYLTDTGEIWDPSSVNTYEEVFEHRDPRMKQSIIAPGTIWLGASEAMTESVFEYPKFANTKNGAMTYSGYYMRKYAELSAVARVGHDDNDIIMMRYAEVLLNYAEAKERLGTLTQDDLDISINLLRDRVGMVHMKLSALPVGSDIRTEIRRERRVELFFEGHRFFDIIRWKEGYRLGADLLGVNRRWLDQSRISFDLSSLQWKTVDGEQYLVIETGRTFNPAKHYLLSLPFKQMQLNPNLKPNNPGWN